jgi:hypothetical protein
MGKIMNNDLRDLILSRLKKDAQKQDSLDVTKGLTLGLDDAHDPSVSGRPGYIWVRENTQQGAVFQAFNQSVKSLVGLPVLITRERIPPYKRVVIGIDWDVLPTTTYAGQSYELVNHASSHEWPDAAPGIDAVTVYPRSLAAFRVFPALGISIGVAKGYYMYEEILTYYPGIALLDLSSHLIDLGYPYSIGLLIYLDFSTNTIQVLEGAPIAVPSEPVYPTPISDIFSLCYIKLTYGMTQVSEVNIVTDLRTPFMFSSGVLSPYVISEVGNLEEELDLIISRHIVEGL